VSGLQSLTQAGSPFIYLVFWTQDNNFIIIRRQGETIIMMDDDSSAGITITMVVRDHLIRVIVVFIFSSSRVSRLELCCWDHTCI
jgi:hypothetical protein